jgi:hypothetical protein
MSTPSTSRFDRHMSFTKRSAGKGAFAETDRVTTLPEGHPAFYSDKSLMETETETETKTLRVPVLLCEPGCVVVLPTSKLSAVDDIYAEFLSEYTKWTECAPSIVYDRALNEVRPGTKVTKQFGIRCVYPSVAQAFVFFILDHVEGLKDDEVYIINCRPASWKCCEKDDDADSSLESSSDEDETKPEAGAGAGKEALEEGDTGSQPKKKKRRRDSE